MSAIKKAPDKRARIKHYLAQSDYITAAWTWFMIWLAKPLSRSWSPPSCTPQ